MECDQGVRDKEFYETKGKLLTDQFAHRERRIDYQKYLDRTGTLDKLTEILMDLYENPVMDFPVLDYVRTRLVNTNPDEEEIKKLRPKLEEMKAHRECVTKENMLLKEKFKINNYPLPGDIIV